MTPDQEIRAKALELALNLYRGRTVRRDELQSDADFFARYIRGEEAPQELYCCGALWQPGHECTPSAPGVQCTRCDHKHLKGTHTCGAADGDVFCECMRPSVPAPRSALDPERCGCTHTWDVHTAWDGCTFNGCVCVNAPRSAP